MILIRWLAIGLLIYTLLTVISVFSGGGKVELVSRPPAEVTTDSIKQIKNPDAETMSEDSSDSGTKMVVNATGVNVRTGPGLDYEVKTSLEKDQRVKVLEVSGEWSRIDLGSNETGWVYSPLISP